jgi:hypothetical protein
MGCSAEGSRDRSRPLGRPDALCIKRRPEGGAGQRSEPVNGANAQVFAATAKNAPLS